ncbi:membrane protein insertion efficiency factor YidD [Planctobacterium marinum]|uniref:membrane protein insertion efficiency factor YidD n=1 Tax=Planctobacterium marinum TaxID=1631968 RepID=UPI001E44E4AF|nr:membrane protein insertion efficiency factor YidD [Planctobacterium marinum]MCC2607212.1 membrane protein insertion efficiency factor YidD [Planctobacterium marinum]
MEKVDKALRRALIMFIQLYQRLMSPILGQNCRFHPTCSQYSIMAIEEHGALKGSWLTIRRIIRCHPLNPGGFDPIPQKTKKN